MLIESSRREYYEVRPHFSLGQFTPMQFSSLPSSTTTQEAAIS